MAPSEMVVNMSISNDILNIIRTSSGISSGDISIKLGKSYNVISGIISSLKRRNLVYNNDKKWYASKIVNEKIDAIKFKLIDVNDDGFNKPWCEGYISALADYNIINEIDFENLLSFITNH